MAERYSTSLRATDTSAAIHTGYGLLLRLCLIAMTVLCVTTFTSPAHAVCSNPAGNAGEIIFNKDQKVMQYCDDTNWVPMGHIPNSSCIEIANAGNAWVQDNVRLDRARDLAIQGNYAYVVSYTANSFTVIDISNPLNPVVANSGSAWIQDATKLSGAQSVKVSGSYAYVTSSNGDSFTVIDISDPLNPAIANSGNAWVQDNTKLDGAKGIDIAGNYAYIGSFSGDTFTVIDISDPLNPVIADSGDAWIQDATKLSLDDIVVVGSYAYSIGFFNNTFTVIDISDPLNPVIPNSGNAWIQDATRLNGPRNLAVEGNYAYVAAANDDTFTVIDISDPLNPAIADSGNAWVQDAVSLNGPQDVAIVGNRAYVTSNVGDSVTIIDISDPLNPVIANSGNAWVQDNTKLDSANGIVVSGNYAYVASFNGDSLTVVNINGSCGESNQIVADGLIGHWKLDETSGTEVIDYASNNNGTMQNGLTGADSVPGKVGTALDFDGNNDFITVPDFIGSTDEITVSGWFYTSDWSSGGDSYTLLVSQSKDSGTETVFQLYYSNSIGKIAFNVRNASETNIFAVATSSAPANTWVHATGVYDGTAVRIYINGVEEDSESLTGNVFASNNIVSIGAKQQGGIYPAGTQNFEYLGIMDDVRIYDRALSADEVLQLYEARDANLRYNADARVPEYFNGDAWVPSGPVRYAPNAVSFDGTNDWLERTSAGGINPSLITGSFWIKRNINDLGVTHIIIHNENAGGQYFRVRINTSDYLAIDGQENGVGVFTTLLNSSSAITDGDWHHVMFSIDSTDRSKDRLYIDGVSDLSSTANTFSAFGGGDAFRIGTEFAPGNELNAGLADVWVDYNTYIDLSSEANRRKFIDANGNPRYLGENGEKVTGTAPDIFLSGDTADWHTNKGTGGGFTENGALTDAAVRPGMLNNAWTLLGSTLSISSISRPYITALTNTTIAFADNNSGILETYSWDGTNWSQVGSTLNIAGMGEPAIAALNNTTIAFIDHDNDELQTYSWNGSVWSPVGTALSINVQEPTLTALDSDTIVLFDANNDDLSTYSWNGTNWALDGSALNIPVSGDQSITALDSSTIALIETTSNNLQTYSWNGTNWSQVGNSLNISGINAPSITNLSSTKIAYYDRGNDELRAYQWNGTDWAQVGTALTISASNNWPALTTLENETIAYINAGDEVLSTYSLSSFCSNPTRPEGTIFYNVDETVLQYCDGENWRRAGK